jgi:preflagellin peptidase FlaK
MEVVRDGETVLILFPKKHGRGNVDDIEGEVTALREMGVDRIWVQPKYPFIVFILFGIIFSFVVGNLMFLLF